MHRSIVFCNAVSADRSGMAASSVFLAAAACVILLRFAAESRTSHCNGSVSFKIDFFWLRRRDPVLELQNRSIFVSRCA